MIITRGVDKDNSGTKWWAVSHSQDGSESITCFNWFKTKMEADKYYLTLPGNKGISNKSRCL